jgi:sulfite oxidase
VNAAICVAGGSKAGPRVISGYALPGGEAASTIAKVEISRDGGKEWTTARLIGEPRPFAWQHWTAEVDLPPGKHELVVRATDSRGNTMPERPEWNFKGYLYNGWHRVEVQAT